MTQLTVRQGFTHYLHFSYKVMGSEISDSHGIIFYEQFGKIGSSHLWLKYFPFENFQGKSGNKLSQIDANGFSQIDIRIETEGPSLEVMKCGARLVYEQDIEDLKQTMAGSSRCSITPYEDDPDESARLIQYFSLDFFVSHHLSLFSCGTHLWLYISFFF